MALTHADRKFWHHFLSALDKARAELEADDFVPFVLVLGRIKRRGDDQAEVGLGGHDLVVFHRPDVRPVDVEIALRNATLVAKKL